jgi:hypothetical protein
MEPLFSADVKIFSMIQKDWKPHSKSYVGLYSLGYPRGNVSTPQQICKITPRQKNRPFKQRILRVKVSLQNKTNTGKTENYMVVGYEVRFMKTIKTEMYRAL